MRPTTHRIAVNSKTYAVSVVPLQARAARINHAEPPAPGENCHVYRLQCSACPGFYATLTSHDALPPENHAWWFEEVSEEFYEHYVDHPGRVSPCVGNCVVTLDGKPFVIPTAQAEGGA